MTTTHERLETGYEPETPPYDSVLRQFLLNQSRMNEIIADRPGGRSEQHDDVSLADAGTVVPFLNQAVLLRPVLDPSDEMLDRVEKFFTGGSTATLLSAWPTPDLSSRGWTLMGHPMFVVGAAATGASRPGVRVEPVQTAEQLAIVERVAVEGYPLPEASGAPAGSLLPESLLHSEAHLRLGFLDDEPVAVGMALPAFGVVNLALAATLPAARRRGVWSAIVRARWALAPDLPAVAFTSDYSRPGFVAMGFLPMTRFTLWLRQPA
ncbi:MAG TPA: hypothetical protein VFX15_08525 [Actinomycetes bacterium]|nr:hypothetical protein [Actinomycetes bacterium]